MDHDEEAQVRYKEGGESGIREKEKEKTRRAKQRRGGKDETIEEKETTYKEVNSEERRKDREDRGRGQRGGKDG